MGEGEDSGQRCHDKDDPFLSPDVFAYEGANLHEWGASSSHWDVWEQLILQFRSEPHRREEITSRFICPPFTSLSFVRRRVIRLSLSLSNGQ
jgi:hypothetical protein